MYDNVYNNGGIIGKAIGMESGSGVWNTREAYDRIINEVWPPLTVGDPGLTYTWYTLSGGTNPTNQTEMDALFNTATVSPVTVTLGGTGTHSTTIDWGSSSQAGAGGTAGTKPGYLPASLFSWKVEGFILASETGSYTFGVDGDDNLDVFVGGINVTNRYSGGGFSGSWITGSIVLFADKYYTFVARQQDGGTANGFQVGWQKPSDSSLALIPSASFYKVKT